MKLSSLAPTADSPRIVALIPEDYSGITIADGKIILNAGEASLGAPAVSIDIPTTNLSSTVLIVPTQLVRPTTVPGEFFIVILVGPKIGILQCTGLTALLMILGMGELHCFVFIRWDLAVGFYTAHWIEGSLKLTLPLSVPGQPPADGANIIHGIRGKYALRHPPNSGAGGSGSSHVQVQQAPTSTPTGPTATASTSTQPSAAATAAPTGTNATTTPSAGPAVAPPRPTSRDPAAGGKEATHGGVPNSTAPWGRLNPQYVPPITPGRTARLRQYIPSHSQSPTIATHGLTEEEWEQLDEHSETEDQEHDPIQQTTTDDDEDAPESVVGGTDNVSDSATQAIQETQDDAIETSESEEDANESQDKVSAKKPSSTRPASSQRAAPAPNFESSLLALFAGRKLGDPWPTTSNAGGSSLPEVQPPAILSISPSMASTPNTPSQSRLLDKIDAMMDQSNRSSRDRQRPSSNGQSSTRLPRPFPMLTSPAGVSPTMSQQSRLLPGKLPNRQNSVSTSSTTTSTNPFLDDPSFSDTGMPDLSGSTKRRKGHNLGIVVVSSEEEFREHLPHLSSYPPISEPTFPPTLAPSSKSKVQASGTPTPSSASMSLPTTHKKLPARKNKVRSKTVVKIPPTQMSPVSNSDDLYVDDTPPKEPPTAKLGSKKIPPRQMNHVSDRDDLYVDDTPPEEPPTVKVNGKGKARAPNVTDNEGSGLEKGGKRKLADVDGSNDRVQRGRRARRDKGMSGLSPHVAESSNLLRTVQRIQRRRLQPDTTPPRFAIGAECVSPGRLSSIFPDLGAEREHPSPPTPLSTPTSTPPNYDAVPPKFSPSSRWEVDTPTSSYREPSTSPSHLLDLFADLVNATPSPILSLCPSNGDV